MFNFLYLVIRPLLFLIDAEKTHDLTLGFLKLLQRWNMLWLIRQPLVQKPVSVAGLNFPNRLGLAAGLDKNGECIDAFAAMGFGYIEVGTVTPRPQPGNEKPRLFRFPKDESIINRFGFNNQGVEQLIENIKRSRYRGVLGINIGKNFDTPIENAIQDYLTCLQKVYFYASYITVNISSPNTANLRCLQFGKALEDLLQALNQEKRSLATKHQKVVPVFVKIAPDLEPDELSQLAKSLNRIGVDGVIATNTTFDRFGLEAYPDAQQWRNHPDLIARSLGDSHPPD